MRAFSQKPASRVKTIFRPWLRGFRIKKNPSPEGEGFWSLILWYELELKVQTGADDLARGIKVVADEEGWTLRNTAG